MLHDLQSLFLANYDETQNDLSWIKAKNSDEQNSRFNVYRRACHQRFREALRDDFPTILALLGNERFFDISQDYEKVFPSKFYSLNDYGKNFSQHLQSYNFNNHEASLISLAAFEWNFIESTFSPDEAAPSPHELQECLSHPTKNLRLAQHVKLQYSHWPLHKIYKDEKYYPEKNSFYLFYRMEFKSYFKCLVPWQYSFLKALSDNNSLEASLESIPSDDTPSESDVKNSFEEWSRLNFFRV